MVDIHRTPLFAYVKANWPRFCEDIDTAQVDEEDIMLYVVWTLDGLKEHGRDSAFCGALRSSAGSSIRKRFRDSHLSIGQDDLKTILDIVGAYVTATLGTTLSGSPRNMDAYSNFYASMTGETRMRAMRCSGKLCDAYGFENLQKWMYDYMETPSYLTMGDTMEWDEEETGAPQPFTIHATTDLPAKNTIHIENLFTGDQIIGNKHEYHTQPITNHT